MGKGPREQQVVVQVKSVRSHLPKGSHKGRQMSHNQATGRYVRQRSRTLRNKILAQTKHLNNHPNDAQAVEAISKRRARYDNV